MRNRWSFALSIALIFCMSASCKDKKKILLPNDILEARTVLVVIDPDAGVDIQAPNANREALQDVERAFMELSVFHGSRHFNRRSGRRRSQGKRKNRPADDWRCPFQQSPGHF